MPWKTTKLVFCGIPLRRRSLYIITLVGAIVSVPTISWALLALESPLSRGQQIGYAVAAVISVGLALNGCRLIIKHNSILFQEEARIVWPGAVVVLLAATGFASVVARNVMKHGRMDYFVPLALGGALLLILLYRCLRLGNHPKRSDIVRGESGRRHSRTNSAASPASAETEVGTMDEDELGDNEDAEPPSANPPA